MGEEVRFITIVLNFIYKDNNSPSFDCNQCLVCCMNVRPCSTALLKSNIIYFLFLRCVCIYYLVYVKLIICKFSLILFFLLFRLWRIIEIFLSQQQQQTSTTSHHYIKGLPLMR